MSVTKLASQCPAPQVPTGAIWIAENAISSGSYTTPNSKPIPAGTDEDLPAFLSENAARVDIGARHGAGVYGVTYGLDLEDGGDLVVNVAAGQAMIDGVVELYEDETKVVGASTTTWIWLRRNGTLEAKTDLTAPAIPAVLLGAVTTDSDSITAFEEGGRVELYSGIPERETADAAEPTDTPPATWRGWTKTLSGKWWWNGTQYERLTGDLAFNKDVLASGETAVIPSNHQLLLFESLTVQAGASLTIQGKLRVIE